MLEDWREAADPEAAVATLRAGWQVQRIIEAAHQSAEGAGWVPLD